jgi:hypothetical protein
MFFVPWRFGSRHFNLFCRFAFCDFRDFSMRPNTGSAPQSRIHPHRGHAQRGHGAFCTCRASTQRSGRRLPLDKVQPLRAVPAQRLGSVQMCLRVLGSPGVGLGLGDASSLVGLGLVKVAALSTGWVSSGWLSRPL